MLGCPRRPHFFPLHVEMYQVNVLGTSQHHQATTGYGTYRRGQVDVDSQMKIVEYGTLFDSKYRGNFIRSMKYTWLILTKGRAPLL
jgi:hypothetical protein